MTAAAMLLAVAAWIGPGPALVRARVRAPVRENRAPTGLGQAHDDDPLAVASCFDVLAVCLGAGMAVATAASAAASSAPPVLARVLRRAADLLALGADPAVAWTTAPDPRAGSADTQVEALLRLARRSAASGAALAEGVAELADQSRHNAAHAATATAERAGVLIAGPLGLCFLPAFVCLGIVPVVAGLAGEVLQSGLW